MGNLTAIEIDANGYVRANFDTGITRTLYQVPLVDIPTPMVCGRSTTRPTPYRTNPAPISCGMRATAYRRRRVLCARESATDVAGELTSLIQTPARLFLECQGHPDRGRDVAGNHQYQALGRKARLKRRDRDEHQPGPVQCPEWPDRQCPYGRGGFGQRRQPR